MSSPSEVARSRTADLPSIGDTVIYHCGPGEAYNGHVKHPAIVTFVHSPTQVNLVIFRDASSPMAMRDMHRFEEEGQRGWSFL